MLNLTLLTNTVDKEIRNKGVIFLFVFTIFSLYLGNMLAVSVKEYVDESNLSTLIANSSQLIILNVVSLITLVVSIIVGINSIRSDISLRILPQILGFSLKRSTYLSSRILGAWFISLVFFTISMIVGVLILKFSGSIVIDIYALLSTYVIYALSFLITTFFAAFVSIYLNKIGSFIFTVAFYFASKASFYNYQSVGFENMEWSGIKILSMLFHYLVPRIGELNFFADNFMSGKTFEIKSLVMALIHFPLSLFIWFLILNYLFSKKEI